MSEFLTKIAVETKARVLLSKQTTTIADLEKYAFYRRNPHNVIERFRAKSITIIAEIKFASPSEGQIRPNTDPVAIADGYLANGASMLSVLTEPTYFKGSLDYLSSIRRTHADACLLRKDFILDPYQLTEAKAYGADAALLIVAMLDPVLFKELLAQTLDLGLTPLVEVHDETERDFALSSGALLIGVNNRNLKTLKVDLDTARRLVKNKPDHVMYVCESGLKDAATIKEMARLGYQAFLIGTSFMKQTDPAVALAAFQKDLA